jgi:4-hydroxy-tetrahydrodipicolinate reductase
VKYALVGYGRMGRAIEQQASARGHELCAVHDPELGRGGRRLDQAALEGAEVAFEFSAPAVARDNVAALIAAGVAVVCGTTGWQLEGELLEAARRAPAGVVVAPNFSVGMNLFYRLIEEAARLFGAAGLHDPYVVETHHRGKRDCPSGTARRLAEILVEHDPRLRGVQEGNPEERLPDGTVHVASVRAGAEPGTHVVGFDGPTDRIVLQHSARSREGFALGAVLAAEWLEGRKGLHGFAELLERSLLKS